MRTLLHSLVTGAAALAAPVSLSLAQGAPPVQPPASPPAAVAKPAVRSASDTVRGLPVDGIAAVVGDQVILVSEVIARANQARAEGAPVNNAADFARLQSELLADMVESELLVQKAKAEKVESNEAELLREVDERQARVRTEFKTDAEFRSALRENGFGSLEEWRKQQIDGLRRRALQRDVVSKLRRDGKVTSVNVAESEVVEAYETNKASLPPKPARISIRQIVMPTLPSDASKKRAKAKADSIKAELDKRPDDFESVAKRESMDIATKDLGGDLGWNRRGRFVPEFERMNFALNPGVISPVFESPFGYHILRVDRVQPAEVKSRHILIKFTLDSTDDVRTRAIAGEVAAAWRKGASVDSLTIRHHDDAAGEQKSIPEFPRDSLPEAYRNAIEGKKVNDILEPFPVPDGSGANKYVIAQITMLDEAGVYTLNEWKERIRAQLAEERSMRRLIDTLKRQTYVSVRYDPLKAAQPITP